MDPNLGLLAASGLANFLLKTTAEWLVCWLLARLLASARSRFNLWLAMLLAFAAQWAWMGVGIWRAAFPAKVSIGAVAHAGGAIAAGTCIAIAAGSAGTVAQAMAVLLAAYLGVVGWQILGAAVAQVRLARVMRYRSVPSERLTLTFHEALEQSPLSGGKVRECELWMLPGLPSPATLGWWKPQVILPTSCDTQDPGELKVVFWHELKHVEREDAFWNAVVHVCRSLLWFHPCVHWVAAALNAERELACDAAVASEHPQSRDVYATCLVRLARQRDFATNPAVVGIEMASGAALLSARVRSILEEGQDPSETSRIGRGALCMMLVGVMVATVPALNVLFAAESSGPMTQLPMVLVHPLAAERTRGAPARMQEAGSSEQVVGIAGAQLAPAAVVQHDEALVAQHRVAMEVLTESTGMDTPAEGGDAHGAGAGGVTRRDGTAGHAGPSWASVAVRAAENAGPLMVGDHDGEGHH